MRPHVDDDAVDRAGAHEHGSTTSSVAVSSRGGATPCSSLACGRLLRVGRDAVDLVM
jgi:hypothetical protein